MKHNTISQRRSLTLRPTRLAWSLAALLAGSPAWAAIIETEVPDLTLRWDNTLKYSSGYRLKDADPALVSDPNQGDGNNNFGQKGLISSRFDLLSELEATYKGFGLRLSGAAWRDSVYLRGNHNNGAAPVNDASLMLIQTPTPTKFGDYTRKVHGRDAEMLDAFVTGKFDVAGHAATVRVGQHTLQWGETLFLGDNGIAGLMSPVDVAKALSVPNLRFQEVMRPVPQVSGQFQINSEVTAYAFYQLRWKENRAQSAGSYFGAVDFATGGDLVWLPDFACGTPPCKNTRTERQGVNDSGQGGLSVRIRGEENDYGIYAVRANGKSPIVVTNPLNSTYYDQYHRGTTALGASISRSVDRFNLAAEISVRNKQELLSPNAYDVGAGAQYAVGRTAHFNASAFATSFGPTALWGDASLLAEVAFSRVLSVQQGAETLSGCQPQQQPPFTTTCQPNGKRDALRTQVLFEPVYFQVVPGLELRVPIGLAYNFKGTRNMVGPAPFAENGGSFTLGLNGTYLDVWRAGLNYTQFFGRQGTAFNTGASGNITWNYQQPFADRDYVSLVVSRSF